MYNWSAQSEVQSMRKVRRRDNGGKSGVNRIQGMENQEWTTETEDRV